MRTMARVALHDGAGRQADRQTGDLDRALVGGFLGVAGGLGGASSRDSGSDLRMETERGLMSVSSEPTMRNTNERMKGAKRRGKRKEIGVNEAEREATKE